MNTSVVPELAGRTRAHHRADTPLAELTTLHLGGPADDLLTCSDTDTLVTVISELDRRGIPTLVVAGGSNLVIADAGFRGTVVHVTTAGIEIDDTVMTIEAGADWDAVVAAAVEAGLGGIECLSGIPGSAGATPVQNVGAYGMEIADVLRRVELLDRRTGEVTWVEPKELGLGYRTSVLKRRSDRLVLRIELQLTGDGLSAPIRYGELASRLGAAEDQRRPVAEVREAVLALRAGKGMVLGLTDEGGGPDHDTWSAGSFFTNPLVPDDALPRILGRIADHVGTDARVPQYPGGRGKTKLSAGWLIERAGYTRGYPDAEAPARLSTKHTLALTNRGRATTADLLELAREVRDGVFERFGVQLTPEPVLIGCDL